MRFGGNNTDVFLLDFCTPDFSLFVFVRSNFWGCFSLVWWIMVVCCFLLDAMFVGIISLNHLCFLTNMVSKRNRFCSLVCWFIEIVVAIKLLPVLTDLLDKKASWTVFRLWPVSKTSNWSYLSWATFDFSHRKRSSRVS